MSVKIGDSWLGSKDLHNLLIFETNSIEKPGMVTAVLPRGIYEEIR